MLAIKRRPVRGPEESCPVAKGFETSLDQNSEADEDVSEERCPVAKGF